MSTPLIAFVTLIYTYVAIENYLRGNADTAVVFGGYAFANIGLIMGMK